MELQCSKCNGPAYKTIIGMDPVVFLIICRGCVEAQARCYCE